MTRPSKNPRLYNDMLVCQCRHIMRLHTERGCRVKLCPCNKKNTTFKKYISRLIRWTYGKRGPIVV